MDHGSRQTARAAPVSSNRAGLRAMPEQRHENETSTGNPRKRIPVACGRCRKRKIRCSGDPGDGSGCQNCRSAGADLVNCQFNRVNSETLEFATQCIPCSNSSVPSNYYGSDLPSPTSAMNTVLSPGAHVSYPKAYGQALSVKTTNSPAYAWAYTEEPSIDTLNLQRPSYGPPHVQEPGGHFYGAQETTRNWTGMSQWMNPNQPGYFDKDPHSHGSISYGQHPGGRVSSVTCEGVSSLNMTSLHSCLPLPNPTSLEARRQLPMPTRNQSISSNSSAAPAVKSNSEQTDVCARLSSHDSNPNLGAVNASPMYRNTSGTNWMGSSSGPESRRSSLNNHLVSTLMPPPVSRPSLSSGATIPIGDVPNANITPMGYVTLGIADNEGPTASNVPSFNYSSSCPSNSYASLGSLNLSRSAPSFSSALPAMPSSHDTLFSRSTSPPPTTTLYSYSTDTGSKSDSADQDAGSSGTLVSGQKYAPLHQPPARCESNAEDPRGDRFAGGVQRDTVEDLENRY